MASASEEEEKKTAGNIPYMFNRNFNSSVRLNYNHWLSKEACGYLMHPSIPHPQEGARIADIGTGTGIWLLELSSALPPSASLDGYDICTAQFPPEAWLPENVHLSAQDAFQPFPADKLGSYDVVHLRFALCYVNDEDAEPLLRNLISLLKPGGYLQWFEPSPYKTEVNQSSKASEPAVALARQREMWRKPRPDSTYNWVENLPALYSKNGLIPVESHHVPQKNRHKQLWFHSGLLGFEDMIRDSKVSGTEKEDVLRKFMGSLIEESAQGSSCDTPWICAVGQKKA